MTWRHKRRGLLATVRKAMAVKRGLLSLSSLKNHPNLRFMPPDHVSSAICKNATEFIGQIKDMVANGERFSPFLGSGISAQSGILMGQEFPDYIAYTVFRVLGCGVEDGVPEYWDIRRRGWPPYPTSQEIDAAYAFILKKYQALEGERCKIVTDKNPTREKINSIASERHHAAAGDLELSRILVPSVLRGDELYDSETRLDAKRRHLKIVEAPTDPNLPTSSTRYILEAALRSLSHWTRTLEFLSKVAVAYGAHRRLYLDDEPDIAVIDSFNAYITRGKKPNLIHNMISRLARSLRSQVLLTTNFDTLIEESYRAQGEPLHVLAVSIKGGLPSFATVRAQDCLIKLHGDILETRADSTINDPPTEKDKKVFFQYLRGPREPQHRQPDDFVQSHLFVLGYSASDARCVQMIKYVLDLDPDFRVFWVSHSDRDTGRICEIFGDYMGTPNGRRMPQVQLYQTDRTDLLLWELYQQINLSLPGGGYNVLFSHYVPPVPYDENMRLDEAQVRKIAQKLVKATTIQQNNPEKWHNIVCIDALSGTARPLQAGFYALQKERYEMAWIELEDHRGAADLHFQLLSVIAQRIGQFQLEWTTFMPAPIATAGDEPKHPDARFDAKAAAHRFRLLVEKFKIDPTKWFFFLYGRNGPGGCCGWSKNVQDLYWNTGTQRAFETLIIDMASMGFRIVYMPHGPKRQEHSVQKIRQVADVAFQHFGWREPQSFYEEKARALLQVPTFDYLGSTLKDSRNNPFKDDGPVGGQRPFREMLYAVCRDFTPLRRTETNPDGTGTGGPGIGGSAPEEGGTRAARCLWLYGLTLFRHSRHPSALISEAVFPCPRKFVHGDWSIDPNDNDGTWDDCDAPKLKDNDLLRNWLVFTQSGTLPLSADSKLDEVDMKGWLNILAENGVVMRKPGGYAWKYRDARLGIQFLMEQVENFHFDAELYGETKELLFVPRLRSLRARFHYWIGEWYMRAYYSTGHHTPLIEAIYHSVQCLEHIEEYVRPRRMSSSDVQTEEVLWFDRLNLSWVALCQLRRLLLVGKKALLFWCPGLDIVGTFFDPKYAGIINGWKQTFHGKMGLSDKLVEKFNTTCDILQHELKNLRAAVQVEGFAHGLRASPHVPYTSIDPNSDTNTALTLSGSLHSITELDQKEWYAKPVHNLCGDGKNVTGIPGFNTPAQRSVIEGLFRRDPNNNLAEIACFKRTWAVEWALAGAREEHVYQGAWLVSEIMYRAVRRAKLEQYATQQHKDKDKDKDKVGPPTPLLPESALRIWRAVCALGHLGLHLCSHLPSDLHEAECDLRVRILTVYAMALTYLERFAEAARRFNEAHALIISGMGTTNGRELARIHLRRAEMYLWKGRVLYHKYKYADHGSDSPQKESSKKLKKIIVCVDDAWSALERGELGLGGVSHSTYWWYRLVSLKLSCYAFLGHLNKTGQKVLGCSSDAVLEASLPFRRRLHLPSVLLSLLRDGLVIGAGDPFRQLRLVYYVLLADLLVPAAERLFGPENEPTDSSAKTVQEPGYLVRNTSTYRHLLAAIFRVCISDLPAGYVTANGLIETYHKHIKQWLMKSHRAFVVAAKKAAIECDKEPYRPERKSGAKARSRSSSS